MNYAEELSNKVKAKEDLSSEDFKRVLMNPEFKLTLENLHWLLDLTFQAGTLQGTHEMGKIISK